MGSLCLEQDAVRRDRASTPIVSESTTPVGRRLGAVIESDPRIKEEHVRLIDGADPPVVLVGVVHDHPASIHRVEGVAPGTVGIELPSLLVPVFERHVEQAADVGGEMAAAIRAAGSTRVVGIDVPGPGLVQALGAELREGDVGRGAALRTLRETWRLTSNAVLARLAHEGVPRLPTVTDLEFGHEYDLPARASPELQAEHETRHVRRSTTLLRTFEPPAATKLVDRVRERHMARALGELGVDGTLVGVVGHGHLDGIEASLEEKSG